MQQVKLLPKSALAEILALPRVNGDSPITGRMLLAAPPNPTHKLTVVGELYERWVTFNGSADSTHVGVTIYGYPYGVFSNKDVRVKLSDLISEATIMAYLTTNVPDTKPKFRVGDIVMIKPSLVISPSQGYPAIGSTYETPVKIIDIKPSPTHATFYYECYTSTGTKLVIYENDIAPVKDKLMYIHPDYRRGIIEFDLLPFFAEHEEVEIYGGKVHNLQQTVVVPLTGELNSIIQ